MPPTARSLLAAVILTAPALALAQPEGESPPEGAGADTARSAVFRLTPRGVHYFTADLDDDDGDTGDVSVSRFGPSASLELPIGEASSLTLGADFLYSFYDFDGTGIFLDDNELLGDAYEVGLSANWSSRINQEWSYFLGGGGRLSMESGADTSEALTGRLFGGFNYRVTERFVLGAGAAVSTQLDDDLLIIPFISAFYQINDRWSLSAGGGPAAMGRTLGATLTWQAREDLGVTLTAAWDRHEFRLDDDGPIPDGIATDSRIDIALGLNWGVADGVSLRVEGGLSAWQQYEFEDEDGDEIADTDADPTAFVGASLNFEF
jgi:hypothetical protein